jgi:large subunit ribosomal protein L6
VYGELMSRIGKKPVDIPVGVKLEQTGQDLKVTGPLGTLNLDVHPKIKIEIGSDKVVVVNDQPNSREHKQLHGTMRALINNMVTGVSKGFERKMALFGTGYNIKEEGGQVVLQVGFCHTVALPIPKGVKVNIQVAATRGNDVPAKFSLTGIDKHVLGQFAADIRKVRPPEPYKGKGLRYADEQVQRKVGKAFASGSA